MYLCCLQIQLQVHVLSILAQLFSKKMSWYCHSPVVIGRLCYSSGTKSLTISDISVSTEDIYLLENQASCFLSKGEPIPVGEVILKNFF